MKTKFRIEVEAFITATGITACRLSREARQNPAILGRLLSGKRNDVMASTADAIRAAMSRLSSSPPPSSPPPSEQPTAAPAGE